MTDTVDAPTLKAWLADGGELALLDVREPGQFGKGHLFFAVPLAYSGFELRLRALVPNPGTRLVLCDDGSGVAERAARRAACLGYGRVHVLAGGIGAWERADGVLYEGVNVPSKAFGELVELERHTPRVSADELAAMREAGTDMVIVDGRPYAEYHRFNIPGGICCPNGELALRIGEIAPDPGTTIVVNCAGRTRSIIGAQTLIDFGVPNRVMALENGTQGWFLAGLEVERGATRRYPETTAPGNLDRRRDRARRLAEARGARLVGRDEVARWLAEAWRTTYLIDVRTEEEHAADGGAGFTHALGGQLVQATDRWIGVRGARIVVADSEEVRAPVVAAWLRQLGHDAHVLAGGIAAAAGLAPSAAEAPALPVLAAISAPDAVRLAEAGEARIIDLRPSMAYRAGHIDGATWSIRPRVVADAGDPARTVVLVAERAGIAELAAIDLAEAGIADIRRLAGDPAAWRQAGVSIAATPQTPADAACIDYLFFTHRRQSDAADARAYLAWETGLVDRLDAQERAAFRISPAPE